jgi:hypothetical protein
MLGDASEVQGKVLPVAPGLTALRLAATIDGEEVRVTQGRSAMAKKVQTAAGEAERKRRTREHIIADLSVHHVEGLALKCGYFAQRVVADYGFDLQLDTCNEAGEIDSDPVRLQLKTSDGLRQYELAREDVFSFPVSAKDYRMRTAAVLPTFFILYDAQLGEAYWLHVQEYAATQQEDPKGQTVRLRGLSRSGCFSSVVS